MSNNGSKWCRPARRLAIYARDGFACVYCEAKGGVLTLDHVQPTELGGTHHETNLVTACFRCNSAKQAKSLRSWLAYSRGAYGRDREAHSPRSSAPDRSGRGQAVACGAR